MKDSSSLPRYKKPKIKLNCSFNGAFTHLRPPENLKYTGGETRVISVGRTVTFSRLHAKISELIKCPKKAFNLNYMIKNGENEEEQSCLAVMESDDDVRCMIYCYEKVEFRGDCCRLWMYVCSDDECVELLNLSKLLKIVVKSVGECGEVKYSDECLRKGLLRKELVAKESEFVTRCFRELGLGNYDENCEDCVNCSFIGSLSRLIRDKVECDYDDDKCRESRSYVDSICHSRGLNVKCRESRSYVDSICHSRGLNVIRDKVECDYEDGKCRESRSYVDSVCHSRGLSVKDGEEYTCDEDNCIERRSYVDSVCHSRTLDVNLGSRSYVDLVALLDSHSQLLNSNDMVDYKCDYANSGESRGYADLAALSVCHSRPVDQKDTVDYKYNDDNFMESRGDLNRENIMTCSAGSMTLRSVLPPGPCRNQFLDGLSTTSSHVSPGDASKPNVYHSHYKSNPSNFTEVRNHRKVRSNGRPCLGKSYPGIKSSSVISKQGKVVKSSYSTLLKHWSDSSSQQVEGNARASKCILNNLTCSFTFPSGSEGNISENGSGVPHDRYKNPECQFSYHDPLPSIADQSFSSLVNAEKFMCPQAHITKEAVSIFSSDKVMEENKQETVLQQNVESPLSIEKKDEIKKTYDESKANGEIPPEITALYNHLAIGELQAIKNSDLEYIKELGSGTYGTVFYGKWKGSDVAIKKLKPGFCNGGAVEENRLIADFWREAHILGQLRHPNIVALYGVVTDGPATNLATVTEFMINGSLKQVFRRKDRTIDRRKRLILAMDTAFGMEYLHENNIVHFDLKSHNLLVNMRDPRRPVCKIGDLGLSKIKQKTLVSGGVRGTIPWMAPELLSGKSLVTEKVDVFSFGIVMWELLTGEEPYSSMRSHEIIAGIIKGTLRPETPAWCDPAWRSLMEKCWSTDPANRPAFSEIAKELRTMATAMNIK
ncbi:uncharacterized protein LOC141708884 [Apium graveolens]|uniref:uncharacterized protein LOC141708884 n=1 Tax=Apium graveolens TaxID=4045 RepID=UPI003D796CD2